MAMSLKKIGAIAVGGAMVATALASGIAAEVTTLGFSDYKELKDILVKDGQPNCYVVVGANAPSTMDVVSAADIAAKIGSLCYKEGTVEDGSADVTVHAEAESDDFDLKKDWNNSAMPANAYAMFVTAADSDYSEKFENDSGAPSFVDNSSVLKDIRNLNKTVDLGDVGTMMKIEDVDPSDWYNDNDDDAAELAMVILKNDTQDELTVPKKDILYASLVYKDDEENFANTTTLEEGMRIPFLGKEVAVVEIDKDDDAIYIGTPIYDGVLKEGETYDLGNGYQIKIKAVLKTTQNNTDVYKVDAQILKDGKVVAEEYDVAPLELEYKDIGVTIHRAWENVGGDYGYAELVISKDVEKLELDEDYIPDWKVYAVLNNSGTMKLEDDINDNNVNNIVGIALRYDGDDLDNLDDGDEVDILDYLKFKFDDEDSNDKLKVYFSMDKKIDATLDIGQKVKALNAEVKLNDIKAEAVEPVPLTAPITKLDTEVSLDTADKNLVLVGGPVANKLTKELVDAGKLALDNNSPATIALIPDAANGHDVIVVAGGDREKTREAALELIKNL